jgi:uncharacterized membrane protein
VSIRQVSIRQVSTRNAMLALGVATAIELALVIVAFAAAAYAQTGAGVWAVLASSWMTVIAFLVGFVLARNTT